MSLVAHFVPLLAIRFHLCPPPFCYALSLSLPLPFSLSWSADQSIKIQLITTGNRYPWNLIWSKCLYYISPFIISPFPHHLHAKWSKGQIIAPFGGLKVMVTIQGTITLKFVYIPDKNSTCLWKFVSARKFARHMLLILCFYIDCQ